MINNNNLFPHTSTITKEDREKQNNHKAFCIWFTGLSCSGKSTIAVKLEEYLYKLNLRTFILDGDNIRRGLNKDLGFSPEDRNENIRRIGETAKLFTDAGTIILTAFISPYIADREIVRKLFNKKEDFIEIYVKASLEICEQRDTKGLYKKARSGEIKEFTGISAPYEAPLTPQLVIDTGKDESIEKNAQQILSFLIDNNYIKK